MEFLGHRNNLMLADSGDDVSLQEPLHVYGRVDLRSDTKQVGFLPNKSYSNKSKQLYMLSLLSIASFSGFCSY